MKNVSALLPLNLSIGDKVTHPEYGVGEVSDIVERHKEYEVVYPIGIKFKDLSDDDGGIFTEWFTVYGETDENSGVCILFPGEHRIEMTTKPLYKTVYVNIWRDYDGMLDCSDDGHNTAEDAKFAAGTNGTINTYITIAHPIKEKI